MSKLPTDAKARKACPVATGVLDYFPLALAEVAHVSYVGNAQHNGEGTPLKWDRSKSSDESDALIRHFLERGTIDIDGCRHSGKLVWRALALLEKELEAVQAPVEPLICNFVADKPRLCQLHQVYLDLNEICPSDPSSYLYPYWLSSHDAAFRTRMVKEAELCT